MLTRMNQALAVARHQEFVDAAERRRASRGRGDAAPWDVSRLWQGLTVRLATRADDASLTRLAALDEAPEPTAPVLVGVVMERPVAALSLADGRVVADPFTPTADVVELLRLRARQLGYAVAA